MARWREALLAAVALLAVAILLRTPALPQDLAYHEFADRRTLLGVPNFWNVVTNLPFLLIAAAGMRHLPDFTQPVPGRGYAVLCVGVLLVAFGSGWYHWQPSNATLAWDRLPMTIAFMALFSLLLSDRISVRAGLLALWPLLLAGVASVVYWQWTEARGAGDLRPYALVQFLPLLLIPLMLACYPGRFTRAAWLWAALGAYGLAKVAELFDHELYALVGFSGHSLKHLLAAAAVWFILGSIRPAADGAALNPARVPPGG